MPCHKVHHDLARDPRSITSSLKKSSSQESSFITPIPHPGSSNLLQPPFHPPSLHLIPRPHYSATLPRANSLNDITLTYRSVSLIQYNRLPSPAPKSLLFGALIMSAGLRWRVRKTRG